VLLFEKPDAIDHLLGSGTRRIESARESRVLSLQELDALGRDNAFHARRLETFEPRLSLKRAPAKRGQLVAEMLHQLLELRESGFLR